MATFRYTAKDINSKKITGKAEANSREELVAMLRLQNLFLLKCKNIDKVEKKQKMKNKELSEFCRELGAMISSGISLIMAMNILTKRATNQKSKEIYNANPYICHYWKYSTKYLIPHDIAISSFTKDPNICVPLYNIFKLYNRNDVEQEFADALSEDGDYANLLEQVSTETTKVFRKIWKDFKDTKIELLSSGTEILTKISEKAKYSFEDRSDGFKKFISIIVNVIHKSSV